VIDDAKRLIAAFFESVDEGLRLLKSEPDLIRARDGLGETPLHYLAVENQLDSVRALVEHGAQVNTLNECGGTPLSEAASLGYVELVKYLLSVGAKLRIEGQKEPILHEAVRSGSAELVNLFLEAGAEVNAANDIGETPLHLAAQDDKNLELVRVLIQSGADINAKGLFDETALGVAQRSGASVIAAELTQAGGR
jgi:ankyrin repeat protein